MYKRILLSKNKTKSSKHDVVHINLPLSKSIANRLIIIQQLSPDGIQNMEWPDSEDSQIMLIAIKQKQGIINIGHAGTAMRFLTAFFACQPGTELELTGSERMQQRPIALLVDALKKLGAQIEYLKNEGFPPLYIKGERIKGGTIEIDANLSSQYISALMLAAVQMEHGLIINLKKNLVSKPYLDMTAALMKKHGAKIELTDQQIAIQAGNYKIADKRIESDWSAAAFWFSYCVLTKQKLLLQNLEQKSIQGDAWVATWFTQHGLKVDFETSGCYIDAANFELGDTLIEIDLLDNPDLAPMFAVLFTALRKKFSITGLQTLPIKESNRIAALITELSKFNVQFKPYQNDRIEGNAKEANFQKETEINTYDDHRMAMAFAALAFVCSSLSINDPEVVAKSYPKFWTEFEKLI